MGVFHVFKVVKIVLNRAKHHILFRTKMGLWEKHHNQTEHYLLKSIKQFIIDGQIKLAVQFFKGGKRRTKKVYVLPIRRVFSQSLLIGI